MAKLGDVLVAAGKLAPAQVRQVLAYQARHRVRFGEACVRQGMLGVTELLPTLSEQLRVPYIYIGARQVPDAVLALLPAQVMCQWRVIPVRAQVDERGRATLYVATAEPQNFQQLDAIGRITRKGVRAVLASALDIERALARHGLLEGSRPVVAGAAADGLRVQRAWAPSLP